MVLVLETVYTALKVYNTLFINQVPVAKMVKALETLVRSKTVVLKQKACVARKASLPILLLTKPARVAPAKNTRIPNLMCTKLKKKISRSEQLIKPLK